MNIAARIHACQVTPEPLPSLPSSDAASQGSLLPAPAASASACHRPSNGASTSPCIATTSKPSKNIYTPHATADCVYTYHAVNTAPCFDTRRCILAERWDETLVAVMPPVNTKQTAICQKVHPEQVAAAADCTCV